jgi:hypothetical protein
MIKFIKNLLGFGSAEPAKIQETVKEILTPPVKSDPVVTATTAATYIEPAKPVNKVKAIGESGAAAVKAATAPKPANKKRRPYRGNKNAGGTVAKVTEGNTKGGNNVVKAQAPAKAKPTPPPSVVRKEHKAPAKKK